MQSEMHRNGYRGRVRTGCLTCRSRKVKCDEARPACSNCTRLKRDCVYKATRIRSLVAIPGGSSHHEDTNGSAQTVRDTLGHRATPGSKSFKSRPSSIANQPPLSHSVSQASSLHLGNWTLDVTSRLEKAIQGKNAGPPTPDDDQDDGSLPAALISRDIELTTTMDFLTARQEHSQLTTFFLDEVDCPGITAFDNANWMRAKRHIVELGKSCPAIALGITAVSTLSKALLYALPLSGALSQYHCARDSLNKLTNDRMQDFKIVLFSAFLLCLFELLHSDEIEPTLKTPSKTFVERLAIWSQDKFSRSSLSIRVIAWLRVIQSITSRGGGTGLLSEHVYSQLPQHEGPIPHVDGLPGDGPSTSNHLYEMLSVPLFDFYYRLQLVSLEIAKLTHYHRSRTTSLDQEEVIKRLTEIKSRLRALWESRSATQRQRPDDLRSQLTQSVANSVISLIGICDAAYHVEFVEMDRVLGDPVSKWTDSRESLQAIREIIDRHWNERPDGEKLNPGYIRPLFLFAIECNNQEQNEWAVEKISAIGNPIYRSEFFSAFAKALWDAQMRKERRVTSKYFCIWYFGGPPPYM